MTASGPSFISYVSEAERDLERDQKLAEAMIKIYQRPDGELEHRLLPGEIAIGHANKVIRYNVHDDPTRGISGTLVCTNFRLIFLTPEKAKYDLIELQNRLLSEHDLLLNNIESIVVQYPNHRKRLLPSSKVKDGIQRLELHCKDFRVAAFNFKLTVKGEEKGVIKPLLHHAYPSTVSRLFTFDYKHDKDVSEVCKIPLYRTPDEWEDELRRCGASKKLWRVSVINRKLTSLPSLGPYFVVPSHLSDSELTKAASQFTGSRIPVWCWTDSNGCSLVRASSLHAETEDQYIEDKLHQAVRNADKKKRPLEVINVTKSCPSCLQLQQSFNKLKALCKPATENDFLDDAHWYSNLNSTKWLQHVSSALSVAKNAAESIRKKGKNVIIEETSGVDLTSVVTSLVQLILDPTCRTLDGFQALIQREWVVAGHPFLDRLGHLLQPTKKRNQVTSVSIEGDTMQLAPVFLLFLDCVYQLMVQYPARFEASITFLTVLYDATRTTAFETFIFNNERHRHKSLCAREFKDEPFAKNEVDRMPTMQLLPVWAWETQFNKSDLTLFNNPLYKMRTMESYTIYIEESSQMVLNRQRLYSDVFVTEDCQKGSSEDINGDVPDSVMAVLKTPRDLDVVLNEEKPAKVFLLGGKKKSSLKEKRTEEHRRKMEKDFPLPLNKPKQKGLEEKKNSPKKEPFKATPGGHFPKIALMPKQRHSAVARPSMDNEGDGRPSRSKSDSEYNEEDVKGHMNGSNDPVKVDDVLKPPEENPFKIRSRFSLRRKKTKENLQDEDASHDNVRTYKIKLQDVAVKRSMLQRSSSIHALYPTTNIMKLKLWRECYFRWLPWSQIYGGGPASTLQQESILYDEIHVLHNKLEMLKRQLRAESVNYHTTAGEDDNSNISGMYFSSSPSQEDNLSFLETNSQTSSQTSLNVLPSYFPYSPVKELRRKSVLGTPMSNFLQGGSMFNFGRSHGKHSRSPSNLSITHSLAQSIEDLSSATVTDSANDTLSPASKSLEDLTSDPGTEQGTDMRYRTQSDVPGRRRLHLLDPTVVKPKKLTPPTSPTSETVTYITSL